MSIPFAVIPVSAMVFIVHVLVGYGDNFQRERKMTVVLLFALLFLLIALGLPIALSIGIPAIGLILTPGVFPAGVQISALGQTIVQLLFAGVDSFDLLAVPLFMLAGAIMETGGISRQLIDFSDSLVGWVPGGLACACIVASMFFAGISGSAAADTAAIGAVVIPAMIRQGYPPAFAAAVVAAGGAIGVIIPPSIPMVIFGFLTNVSIAKLFAGGMMVGVLFGCSFMVVSIWICLAQGYGLRQRFSPRRVWASLKERYGRCGRRSSCWAAFCRASSRSPKPRPWRFSTPFWSAWRSTASSTWQELPELIIRSQITAATILLIIAMAKVFTWLVAMKQTTQLVGAAMTASRPAALGPAAAGHGRASGGRLRHGNHGGPDPAGAGPGCPHPADGR